MALHVESKYQPVLIAHASVWS